MRTGLGFGSRKVRGRPLQIRISSCGSKTTPNLPRAIAPFGIVALMYDPGNEDEQPELELNSS